jgi:hypothetical protein
VGAEPTPSGSVELRDDLAVLRRQLVVIVAVALLGAGAAAAWTLRRTPVYQSTASVLVRAITTNAFDPGQRIDQQLKISLNNRLKPLNVQLNGFLSLDFTPGTVIAAAALPGRPAPTAASTSPSACSSGCSLAWCWGSSATAPTTGCGAAPTWPSGWTGRSWPLSRPCPGGSATAGCAGGPAGTAWSPWSSPTARPPSPTGPCGPAWPGWPASSTSPR